MFYHIAVGQSGEIGRRSKKKMMRKATLNPQVLLGILFPTQKVNAVAVVILRPLLDKIAQT